MNTTVQIADETFEIDLDSPIDISIPLQFNGPQPNAFGVERATSKACEYGSLIGDTRRGGSVNFEQYTLIPHCNGTHTECVGHITNERISVRDCLTDALIRATLVSVEPEAFEDDLVITESRIRKALDEPRAAVARAGTSGMWISGQALILRTLPNDDAKPSRTYSVGNLPYYFTQIAMEFIVDRGFKHLLVDLPSIDRLFDKGKLLNHRIFWNVEPGSFEVNANTRMNSTITELIYVPDEVEDGEYLLNLQIAPFASDAAPSRPILFGL
jgi:kynurenine formamidase